MLALSALPTTDSEILALWRRIGIGVAGWPPIRPREPRYGIFDGERIVPLPNPLEPDMHALIAGWRAAAGPDGWTVSDFYAGFQATMRHMLGPLGCESAGLPVKHDKPKRAACPVCGSGDWSCGH
jgi:hypothetical protein